MINRYLYFTVIILIFANCAEKKWKTYSYKENNFQIDFYKKPENKIDTLYLKNEILLKNSYFLNVNDDNHDNSYYSISHTIYPNNYINSDSSFSTLEGFINSSQDKLVNDENNILLSSIIIYKNGYFGKSFKWKKNKEEYFFENQVFLIKNNLYELNVVSKIDHNHNIYINQFFNSFIIQNIEKGSFYLPENEDNITFSIDFPQCPKTQTQTVDTEGGKLDIIMQIYEPKNGDKNNIYIASETKYPDNGIDTSIVSLELFYEKAINGTLISINGKLISSKTIYYKNYMGKEYKVNLYDGITIMLFRYFFINNYFYNFGVATIPANENNDDMNNFINSFKILK